MAIKHDSKFYVRLCRKTVTFPENFRIIPGSIYGRFEDKNGERIFWVCDNYALVNGKLPVHIYCNGFWKLYFVSTAHPCYKWVKMSVEKLGEVPKIETESLSFSDCKSLMKTYSRHKKGTGSRINTHQINQALRWNEVTEIAHWHGKGKASVVAADIR